MTPLGHVYLAGPIGGRDFQTAVDWRERVKNILHPSITSWSPLRGKDFLMGQVVGVAPYTHHPLATDAGIVGRDHADVARCDVLLCNLLGARTVSLGSMVELGWASAYQKLIVVAMETDGNPHDHPFVRRLAHYVAPTLAGAVDLIHAVLLPWKPLNVPADFLPADYLNPGPPAREGTSHPAA